MKLFVDQQIAKLERELKDANDLLEAARKKGIFYFLIILYSSKGCE